MPKLIKASYITNTNAAVSSGGSSDRYEYRDQTISLGATGDYIVIKPCSPVAYQDVDTNENVMNYLYARHMMPIKITQGDSTVIKTFMRYSTGGERDKSHMEDITVKFSNSNLILVPMGSAERHTQQETMLYYEIYTN